MKLLDKALYEAKKYLLTQTADDMFYNLEHEGQQFDLNVYYYEGDNGFSDMWRADLYCVFNGKTDTSARIIVSENLSLT
jgi:hypothetical protein